MLAAGSLEEAEQAEAGAETPEEEIEDRVIEEIRSRGRLPNLSTFAFTARSPSLELFGRKRPDGKFELFHRYSMRQAIEEGFILDVLAPRVTDDPDFGRTLKNLLSTTTSAGTGALRNCSSSAWRTTTNSCAISPRPCATASATAPAPASIRGRRPSRTGPSAW